MVVKDIPIAFGMLAFVLLTFCILGGFIGFGTIWGAVVFLMWTLAFTGTIGLAVWRWHPGMLG